MLQDLFYPGYIVFMLIFSLIVIPSDIYKKLIPFALLAGGLMDFLLILLFSSFGMISYNDAGVFKVFKINFLAPIAWAITHLVYLYFLPQRKILLYPYIVLFATFSFCFGFIVKNIGLYDFNRGFYFFLSPLIYLFWWAFSAWFYKKYEP